MAVLFAAALPVAAQIGIGFPGGGIGFPGGGGRYPGGGGYPGGGNRYPGAGRGQMPPDNVNGIIENISSDRLILTTDDKVELNIQLARNTRFIDVNGRNAKNTDFNEGDRVSIDANLDNNNLYHAIRVTQIRVGTPQDRNAGAKSSAPPNDEDDPDRPRLHRSDTNTSVAPPSPASDQSVAPQITRGDPPASASSSPSSSSTVASRPRSSQPQAVDDSPIPPAPDDSGPPVLRRGRPSASPATNQSQPTQVASAERPSIHADDVNGVTRLPEPPRVDNLPPEEDRRPSVRNLPESSRGGDPVIEKAREAVFSFSESLPNYVVKQYTTRYESEAQPGRKSGWRALDNVTADVIMENGVERYKNILVNGRTPREAPEKSGSWSSGEFSSLMQDVFSSSTNAEFHGQRSTTIANRQAWRYDFSVMQVNSHWHVEAGGQNYLPGYTGTVWIDKETSRVLRLELSARDIPRSFPLDQVESAVDYDFTVIGDGRFLLPVHSEALSCERGAGSAGCSRNVIDFRNYRKFTSESSISFDPN